EEDVGGVAAWGADPWLIAPGVRVASRRRQVAPFAGGRVVDECFHGSAARHDHEDTEFRIVDPGDVTDDAVGFLVHGRTGAAVGPLVGLGFVKECLLGMPGVGPDDDVVFRVANDLIPLADHGVRMGTTRSEGILGDVIGPDGHASLPAVIGGALEPYPLTHGVEAKAARAAGADTEITDS